MNDRYLFRGKCLDGGEWVEGYLYHDQRFINGHSCCDVFLIRGDCDEDHEINENTIGQCTGLEDKNGKLIFEGDILDYPEYADARVVVKWVDNKHYCRCGWYVCNTCTHSVKSIHSIDLPEQLEIIGNVVDNPELTS